jgi:hypothetical protein
MRSGYVFLLAVFGYFMIRDLGSAERGVSVFAIKCEKVVGDTCAGKLTPIGRVRFVAFPDSQRVVKDAWPILERLEGCVVADWQTWTCTEEGSDGTLTKMMDHGELSEYFTPHGSQAQLSNQVVYVSAWWRYYWYTLMRAG